MKQTSLLCSLLFVLFTGHLFSQTLYDDVTLEPDSESIVQTNGTSYSSGATASIGKDADQSNYWKYRTYFEVDLSSIPDNATITEVEVEYLTDGSGYTFKLTQLSSISGSAGTDWGAIGSGSSLATGLSYGSNSFVSSSIKTAMQNALSNDELIIGALSEDEGTTGSDALFTRCRKMGMCRSVFTISMDSKWPSC